MAGSSNLSLENKQIHHILVTKRSLRLQLLIRWSTVHWVAWLLLFLLLPPVWFDPFNISHACQIMLIKVCVLCPHRPQDEQDPGCEVSRKVGLLHQLILLKFLLACLLVFLMVLCVCILFQFYILSRKKSYQTACASSTNSNVSAINR